MFAVLDQQEFVRAQVIIEDFARWNSFDEFNCERDGEYIALICAGHEAHQTEVSIEDFQFWTDHSGASRSLVALDEFASCVHAFRLRPNSPVRGIASDQWRSTFCASASGAQCVSVPIADKLYQEWAHSLSRIYRSGWSPSIDDYAKMLLQSWCENQ